MEIAYISLSHQYNVICCSLLGTHKDLCTPFVHRSLWIGSLHTAWCGCRTPVGRRTGREPGLPAAGRWRSRSTARSGLDWEFGLLGT